MTKETITVRHAPRFCPVCFSFIDAISAVTGDSEPEPGDFTICFYCRAVLRIGEDFTLTKSSLMEIPTHSRMMFVKAIRLMEQNPPPPRRDNVKRS